MKYLLLLKALPLYTLIVTLPQRSRGSDWTLRLLLVLIGIAAPFATMGLISAIPFGIGFIAWFFSIACISIGLSLFTALCYELVPALRRGAPHSAQVSLIFAALTPVASTALFLFLPVLFGNIDLERNYTTLPEWIIEQQIGLETSWRENPSTTPWRILLLSGAEIKSIEFRPNLPSLSTYNSSTDTHTSYYEKSEVLELNEVPIFVTVELESPENLNLDFQVTLFRNGTHRVDRLSTFVSDYDASQSFFSVASCPVIDGHQQIILDLANSLSQLREQQLTVSGNVGDREFDIEDVRWVENRLEINLLHSYGPVALREDFYGDARFNLHREFPIPEVWLTFDFSQELRECLKNEQPSLDAKPTPNSNSHISAAAASAPLS